MTVTVGEKKLRRSNVYLEKCTLSGIENEKGRPTTHIPLFYGPRDRGMSQKSKLFPSDISEIC